VPPAQYFAKIQAVLEKYDVLFVDDEVICGFGRTGNMWGAETFNMKPHTISVAKALSSAYVPIGAVMIPEDIYQGMLEESRKIGTFGHGFTYSGHPLGAAVAQKTLDIYARDNIVEKVRGVAPIFQNRLAKLADHPLVGETRGMGLVGGLELVADKDTKRVFNPVGKVGAIGAQYAQDNGLLLRNIGDTLALCPPLIITIDEINEMFDRLETALDLTETRVGKEGMRAV
jgi:4-aminobutyrate---pyruvate transaminase